VRLEGEHLTGNSRKKWKKQVKKDVIGKEDMTSV
jgi:hypothetical protein